ncbi:hypothetical protein [Chryseobacterium sp.]|uniref:hypothetical protein n=1 Tax=Chryseobacterium sp. TaxID=1871047 RepID=UPI00289DB92D|nr:hypothetical protein [Chryseobacterium sp.]
MKTTKGLLINDIELGFSPISAYHFSLLIRDKKFYQNVEDSHLYIIAQRKEITFHNFSLTKELILNFDICQEDNEKVINCSFPLDQENINPNLSKFIEIRIHNRKNTIEKKLPYPYNGTQAFSIQERDPHTNKTKIISWFSPDKLFLNHWRGNIRVNFSDSYSSMLDFNVHYVGKSTEQNICRRLSNHSTFQEILMTENALTFGNIPSNEIMLLLLRIMDNNTIVSWGHEASPEEMSDYILNYTLPSDKKISLDAEKALINHLQPAYNKILYNSFPSKDDLIHTDYHSVFLYAINDPISLIYEKGKIKGGKLGTGRDFISVEREKNQHN